MPNVIAHVPRRFDLKPLGGRWFSWAEIRDCFWPGKGRRASDVNRELADIRDRGGVYLVAWSAKAPKSVHPREKAVWYIGETIYFRNRMGGFGNSAGFWGERGFGHSAAWRWPEGKWENMWVAFFEVGGGLPSHLAVGLRKWLEAVAMEEYNLAHKRLPKINAALEPIEVPDG